MDEPDFIIDFDLDDICLLYKSVSVHLETDGLEEEIRERLLDLQMHLYKTILECKFAGGFE